jgi:spore maturation protein CgeB
MERIRLLAAVGKRYPVKLFTMNKDFTLPGVQNMGITDYFTEMPYVFYHSKINLNITLRSIQTGMNLRSLDIMSSGGFLLTNYQEDFLDYFIPGEDFDFFTDRADLLDKIDYYLSHEEKRAAIAQNGYQKVRQHHTYELRFQEILSIVFQ